MGRNLNGSKLYGSVTASTSGLALGSAEQAFQTAYTNQVLSPSVLYIQNWSIDNSGFKNSANTSGYSNTFQIGRNNTINTNVDYSLAVGTGNTSNNTMSTALGYNNSVTGQFASGLGNYSTVTGNQATAVGCLSQAKGDNSLAVGTYCNVSQGSTNSYLFGAFSGCNTGVLNTMVLGGGFGSNAAQKLLSNKSNSIFIGINSTVPSLFVGGGNGTSGSLGNVGINLTDPTARLDILANSATNSAVRIRAGAADPSVAYDGDIWYNGRLKHRVGTVNQTIAYMSDIISASTSGSGSSSASVTTYNITGNSSTTAFTVTHNKGTKNVIVQIIDSNYDTVIADVTRTNINYVTVTFSSAPATGETYSVLVI